MNAENLGLPAHMSVITVTNWLGGQETILYNHGFLSESEAMELYNSGSQSPFLYVMEGNLELLFRAPTMLAGEPCIVNEEYVDVADTTVTDRTIRKIADQCGFRNYLVTDEHIYGKRMRRVRRT